MDSLQIHLLLAMVISSAGDDDDIAELHALGHAVGQSDGIDEALGLIAAARANGAVEDELIATLVDLLGHLITQVQAAPAAGAPEDVVAEAVQQLTAVRDRLAAM